MEEGVRVRWRRGCKEGGEGRRRWRWRREGLDDI